MSGESFKWLGLLKWSLAYNDGTNPNAEKPEPLSEEKIAFLEKVMNEGIVDENKRMGEIIKELGGVWGLDTTKDSHELTDNDHVLDLLAELRELIDQIDFSLSFCQQGGLPYMLGASGEVALPLEVRAECLAITATLTQNNLKVQEMFKELNGVERLCTLYSSNDANTTEDAQTKQAYKLKVLHALSCSIRACKENEVQFLLPTNLAILDHATTIPASTQSSTSLPTLKLNSKGMFLLRALLQSDTIEDKSPLAPFLRSVSLALAFTCCDPMVESADKESEYNPLSCELNQLRELCLGTIHAIFSSNDVYIKELGLGNLLPLVASLGKNRVAVLAENRRKKKEGNDEEEEFDDTIAEMDLWGGVLTFAGFSVKGETVKSFKVNVDANAKDTSFHHVGGGSGADKQNGTKKDEEKVEEGVEKLLLK